MFGQLTQRLQDASNAYPQLTISFLRSDTPHRYCTEYPDFLWKLFTTRVPGVRTLYGRFENGVSILVLPETFEAYWESIGKIRRRRVRRALEEGYEFAAIDRDAHLDEIYAINTSMEARQGRPMREAYRQRPGPFGPLPDYGCPRHRVVTFGVLREGVLVAYTWVYQVGEMCLFSTILGHGEHLNNGIMYLLVSETVRELMSSAGLRFAMYSKHGDGTEGLRFFKEHMGFSPYLVQWVMGDATDPARKLILRGKHLAWSANRVGRELAHLAKRDLLSRASSHADMS